MLNPSRDQARQFFIDTWAKYQRSEPLTPLEQKTALIISEHPEYHRYLENATSFLHKEWRPEGGEINPFMHLGLHLAIVEQLDIDRPQGIRDLHAQLASKHGDPHAATHDLLECLGETLWQSQRSGQPLDSNLYLQLMQERLHR